MRRRTFLAAVSLSTLGSLAGCAGDGSDDGDTGGTDTTSPPDTTPDGSSPGTTPAGGTPATTASGTTPSGGTPEPGTWTVFDFTRPGRWEYDVYLQDSGEGTVTLDVQSVSADSITVKVTTDLGEQQFQTTYTGPPESVRAQVLGNPAGVLLSTTMFAPAAWYAGRELTVGTQWSYTTSEGSASFAVTGTDSVAGVDCYRTRMQVDGTTVYESCLSPDHGLAPYTAWYAEDGTLEMEMRLRSYTPG